ncbi:MAG: hypothetical protein J5I90_10785 [Caldilineales bacterium]|nr:hypothetical protein [Caldilineales bacterium]
MEGRFFLRSRPALVVALIVLTTTILFGGATERQVLAAPIPGANSLEPLAPADQPEEIATGFSPTALLRNDTHLFVARQGHGLESCGLDPSQSSVVLQRMNFDGSGKTTLLERCHFSHSGFAVDQTHLYFGDSDGSLKRMPVGGGALQTLVADGGGCCVLDDTYVYWTRREDGGPDNEIWRIVKSGAGAPELVASLTPPENTYFIRNLAIDDTYIYWTEGKTGIKAIDQPGVGAVKRVPKAGGAIQTLADVGDGIENPGSIALDATHIYWVERDTARARRVAKTGGAVLDYSPSVDGFMAEFIAVNNGNVYWTDTNAGYAGKVRRADKGGGGLADLAIGLLGPGNLVLTDNYVYFTQGGGVYRLPLGASDIAVDLSIDAIEVTQVIQDMANGVRLIADKPAFVRVYASTDVLPGKIPRVQLRGFKGAVELDWSPLRPIDEFVPVRTTGANRFYLDHTYNFWAPEHWRTGGEITLRAEINFDGEIKEFETGNNNETVVVNFRQKKPVCVEMVRVKTDPQTASTGDDGFYAIVEWMRQAYPSPAVLIDAGGTIKEGTGPYELPDDTNKVLARVGWYRLWHDHNQWQKCGQAHFFGMVHPTEMSAGGIGYRPGWSAWGVMATDSFSQTIADKAPWYAPHGGAILAHEVGHNKGRKHVDCGGPEGTDNSYPYNPCWLSSGFPGSEVGFDYWDDVVIGPTDAGDLMSYAMSVGNPRWPSAYTYEAIEDKIPDTSLAAATTADHLTQAEFAVPDGVQLAADLLAADDVLLVSALVTPTTESASFDQVYSVPAGTVRDETLIDTAAATLVAADGPYTLRLLDAGENTLDSLTFDLPEADPPPWIDVEGSSFVLAMPFAEGTAHLTLEQGGNEMLRRSASANAPTVTVLEPNGGESYAGSLTIRWEAKDLDGDDLTYLVQYSPDMGQSWRLVETDVMTDVSPITLTIDDLTGIPGTKGMTAMVRVIASDGLLTGMDESDRPFSLRPQPPQAGINNPSEGEIVGYGNILTLAGGAFDAEDGELTGEQLSWFIDGVSKGKGKELPIEGLDIGKHVVRLVATDSGNMTDMVEHTFYVQKQYCDGNQNMLDLTFVIDNGPAMSTHANEFCKALPGIIDDLEDVGLKVQHRVFDIVPARTGGPQSICATDVVQSRWRTDIDHPSDWGEAVAVLAERLDWKEGYTRMIVPVTNVGPEDGNPTADPGPDRDAIDRAIAAAQDAAVTVSPLMMPPADSINYFANMALAEDLAIATGGTVMQWGAPNLDIAAELQDDQAQHGCEPDVDAIIPGVAVGPEEEICLSGQHLWPGTGVQVDGRPATDSSFNPDANLLCFRLPPGTGNGEHQIDLDRPGAPPNPNTGTVHVDPTGLVRGLYLPLMLK